MGLEGVSVGMTVMNKATEQAGGESWQQSQVCGGMQVSN